ncbi:MAG: hypothetical protein KDI44_12075 [Thiothrix sp.]|nr:hypothetical protein [Thiothrix sp.]HPQ95155.1 hypothetical protein [Thiolinea sp.]
MLTLRQRTLLSALLMGLVTCSTVLQAAGTGDETLLPEQRKHIPLDEEGPVIGSWMVRLDGGRPALFSFLPGGVLIESETPLVDPILNNMAFSNAHGAWQLNEDGGLDIRYFKLAYQADAAYLFTVEANGSLYLQDNGSLSGNIRIEEQDNRFQGHKILLQSRKLDATRNPDTGH